MAPEQPGVRADLPQAGLGGAQPRRYLEQPAKRRQESHAGQRPARRADFAAIGITNQRETTVVWDRRRASPIHNAIVWQDRRTAASATSSSADGWADEDSEKTGLVIDAYFSGTKVKWLLDNVDGARDAPSAASLLFGTVDTWLDLAADRRHSPRHRLLATPARTMLFNIHTLAVGRRAARRASTSRASMLPEVALQQRRLRRDRRRASSAAPSPSRAIAGDQQAAPFGQACFAPGMAKNTYGTGCFMLMNTGENAVLARTAC